MHLGGPVHIVVAATAALHLTRATQLNGTVFIPPTTPFLLPPFFVGGNETSNFVDTKTGDITADVLLAAARNASFIAYHPEFFSIFGPKPELTLLADTSEGNLFYEAGVWFHDRNEVLFSGDVKSNDTLLTVVNLATGEFHHPNTSQPVLVGNGGHYFDGKVYITTFGNATYAGGRGWWQSILTPARPQPSLPPSSASASMDQMISLSSNVAAMLISSSLIQRSVAC